MTNGSKRNGLKVRISTSTFYLYCSESPSGLFDTFTISQLITKRFSFFFFLAPATPVVTSSSADCKAAAAVAAAAVPTVSEGGRQRSAVWSRSRERRKEKTDAQF